MLVWCTLLLAVLAVTGCGPREKAPPQSLALKLVPWPHAVRPGQGVFVLSRNVSIAVESGTEEDRFAAELLKRELEQVGGVAVSVGGGGRGRIVLARKGAPRELGEEGYRVRVTRGGVRVTAPTGAGIFYGVQTLRQMIHRGGIPIAEIEDRPAMRWRGVQLDVSRGPIPTLVSLKRRVETLAEYKVNLLVLYLENSYGYKEHPVLLPPGGFLTEAEVRELVEFAGRQHVTVVPQQQTFGHLHPILSYEKYRDLGEVPYGSVLTPVNPGTYALIKSFYDELAPLFPGPFFHIGGDEPRELGVGLSREVVQQAGDLGVYVTHMMRTRAVLAPHRKSLLFWADIVVPHPELLADFPPDMIPMSWNYDLADSLEPWIRPFRDAKREFFICPGVANWNRIFPDLDVAIPNIRSFTREGQKAGAIGQLNCTWSDNGDALFGLCWYPLLFGAAAAWQEGDCDPQRFRAAFDWAFFRSEGEGIAQAIERIAAAHRLARMAGAPAAGIDLTWRNPYDPVDREVLGRIVPLAFAMRRAQEGAIELVERGRPTVRRNGDQLDYLVFAARRLHYVGFKAILTVRARDTYLEALRGLGKPAGGVPPFLCMSRLRDMTGDGSGYCSILHKEFERLWLAENRPYFLESMKVRFLRENLMWLEQSEKFDRLAQALSRFNRLPPPESVGLTPVSHPQLQGLEQSAETR